MDDTKSEGLCRRYTVIDKATGEAVSLKDVVKLFVETENSEDPTGFELSYPSAVRAFYDVADNPRVTVLNHLLARKSTTNVVSVTQQSIVEDTGVSKNVVALVMTKLQKAGMLKRIRHGTYLLNPDVSVRGGRARWLAKDNWRKGRV